MYIDREYQQLNQTIHAPEELKARVLQAAAKDKKKKARNGNYNRGWSFVQKAAAAAILLVCLPITAYAAVKGFGLLDYLNERGMQDIQSAEQLVVTPSELYGEETEDDNYCTTYASYTILEALCDSQTIYLAAQVKPLDDYFLIPQYLSPEDSVANLIGMETVYEENPGMTIEEYAAAQGKSLAYAGVGYWINVNGEDQHVDGGEVYSYDSDGTLYYYHNARNNSGSKEFMLKCSCNGYVSGAGMEDIERVSFEVKVSDKSTAVTEPAYTMIDASAYADTGIQVRSLTIETTEMGLYATFTYSLADAEFEDVFFKIVNQNGEELSPMPVVSGTGSVDNGDGTFQCTVSYQKPASMEGLQFVIRNISDDINYGPYSFG